MGAIAEPLPWWLSRVVVIGAVMLLAAIAARAAAAQALPEGRQPQTMGGSAATNPSHASRTPGWTSRLPRSPQTARSAPVPAAHVAAWCDALSRRLRAGDALRTALAEQHPDNSKLAARTDSVRRSLGHGATVADALATTTTATTTTTLRQRSARAQVGRDPHLELLCSVVAATAEFGGGAAAPIDRVGATLRLRSADGQERAAQSAQARLSAHVLTVVPLSVLALLVGTDADVREVSTAGPGLLVISVGLALNLTGSQWMKRIITGEAS
jgi:Flp pilus assembly protein TadB